MTNFTILLSYLIIGIIVSFYMINFYKKNNKDVTTKSVYLGVIGPFVWPIQIIKHIYDLVNLYFK